MASGSRSGVGVGERGCGLKGSGEHSGERSLQHCNRGVGLRGVGFCEIRAAIGMSESWDEG